MLTTGDIPSDFGRGIIIPLPKCEGTKGAHKIDSFRGITLSPLISKVFEHCLMDILCDYLYTDDRQFGFKPNVGCPHAIYAVRHLGISPFHLPPFGLQENASISLQNRSLLPTCVQAMWLIDRCACACDLGGGGGCYVSKRYFHD